MPPVAAGAHFARLPAFRAEAVAVVPGQKGGALGQRAERRRIDQPLHVDGAVVDRLDRVGQVFRRCAGRRGEQRLPVVLEAEQDRPAARRAKRADFRRCIPGVEGLAVRLEVEPALAHQHEPGARIGERLLHAVVGTVLGLAVETVAGKADQLAGLARRRVEKAESHGTADSKRMAGFAGSL